MEREGGWLGSRDSNPGRQIQSLLSYHWTTPQRHDAGRYGRARAGVNDQSAITSLSELPVENPAETK